MRMIVLRNMTMMKGVINMTRKHYRLIADAIKESMLYKPDDPSYKVIDVDLHALIYGLCWRLKGDNERFDSDTFKDYINE